MAERKKTPNILGDLLGGLPSPASTPAETVSPNTDLTAKPKAPKADKPQGVETASLKSREDAKAAAIETLKQGAVLPVKPKSTKAEKTSQRPVVNTVSQHNVLPAKPTAILTAPDADEVPLGRMEQDEVGEEEETGPDLSAKIKVTFYLSEEAVDHLEDTQSRLRRLGRASGRRRGKAFTSKSAILEEAVRLVCSELEEKGLESQLAKSLL